MHTILFVCTGNTCRSPMAEAIARQVLRDGLTDEPEEVLVASAGILAADGLPPSAETLAALRAAGIDHVGRSKPLTAEMVRKADVIFCMSRNHLDAAIGLAGGDKRGERILLLDPEGDIEDPIGSGQAAYDVLLQRLRTLIPRRLREVLADENRARIRPPG